MTRKLSDYRVVAEIQCPGFSGGSFTVNRKRDYCALEAAAKESVLGLGCTITLKSVHKSKVPEQGSMFSRKKTTPQQSLFGLGVAPPPGLKPGTRVSLRLERHPIYAESERHATYREFDRTFCVTKRGHLRGMRRDRSGIFPLFRWSGDWLSGRKARYLVLDVLSMKPGRCDPVGRQKAR
jgi:hypothetical protein